ncbi:hypothetical protein FRX31_022396 [Thalictrum thalictroides]|uniref:RNase H type-1 domain-containing protein n=1 Tax=Thalictrum thalictroides TaxID=46969 RepID=A0A7J6VSE5_THATH|nr:hypothetical protein FRX31_022396 [Thalictrum thalictroides]
MRPKVETAEHLFIHSELATQVWSHFSYSYGISMSHLTSIRDLLALWFKGGKKGSMEYMCHTLTPMVCLWEIWKERCSRTYEDGFQRKGPAIIFKIRFWLIRLCECYTPSRRSRDKFSQVASLLGLPTKNPRIKMPSIVYWTRPPDPFVALNVDGSAQNGQAAGGGIIRTNKGQHITNFFKYYGIGTNNMAETRALLDGLTICIELGLGKVQIQTDSKLVVQWFGSRAIIPWSLSKWWKEIREKAAMMEVMIAHVYREGNNVADFLSKWGMKHKSGGALHHRNCRALKQFIAADEHNIPNIRYSKI